MFSASENRATGRWPTGSLRPVALFEADPTGIVGSEILNSSPSKTINKPKMLLNYKKI